MFTDNKIVHGHTLIDQSTTPSMNKTNEIRSNNNPKSHESESGKPILILIHYQLFPYDLSDSEQTIKLKITN